MCDTSLSQLNQLLFKLLYSCNTFQFLFDMGYNNWKGGFYCFLYKFALDQINAQLKVVLL